MRRSRLNVTGPVNASDSSLTATTAVTASNAIVRIGDSKLDGAATTISGGTLTCVGAYNGSYAARTAGCQ